MSVRQQGQRAVTGTARSASGRRDHGSVARASDQEIKAAEAEADYLTRLREIGDPSIPITIRMPRAMLDSVREAADREGVRYQTLMKDWIHEKLAMESRRPTEDLGLVQFKSAVYTFMELFGKVDPAELMERLGKLATSGASQRPRKAAARSSRPSANRSTKSAMSEPSGQRNRQKATASKAREARSG
jgi:predicted DNA binding CopG/RHH family protein